jgi:hypothetical protein
VPEVRDVVDVINRGGQIEDLVAHGRFPIVGFARSA